jgi:hypothetical protein
MKKLNIILPLFLVTASASCGLYAAGDDSFAARLGRGLVSSPYEEERQRQVLARQQVEQAIALEEKQKEERAKRFFGMIKLMGHGVVGLGKAAYNHPIITGSAIAGGLVVKQRYPGFWSNVGSGCWNVVTGMFRGLAG